MRCLGLALFAEGPTDHDFLGGLLLRVVRDLCARKALTPVELGEVRRHHSSGAAGDAPRELRILEAARADLGAWDLLFIHADGNSDQRRAREERVEPAVQKLVVELAGYGGRTVAVVPVRSTEAWMLVDGEALREVFGSSFSDEGLGLPARPRDVEKLSDPRAKLRETFQATTPRRRALRRGWDSELLAARVSLQALRQVPAYQRFEEDLEKALKQLQVIP